MVDIRLTPHPFLVYFRDSVEEYLTADERDDSIDASPSEAVEEEKHSHGTASARDSSSDDCRESTSPEGSSEESPPSEGLGPLPAASSLPQSTSSSATGASWRPEYWEVWHARNKGVGTGIVEVYGWGWG